MTLAPRFLNMRGKRSRFYSKTIYLVMLQVKRCMMALGEHCAGKFVLAIIHPFVTLSVQVVGLESLYRVVAY
jgi:hypothetical protein